MQEKALKFSGARQIQELGTLSREEHGRAVGREGARGGGRGGGEGGAQMGRGFLVLQGRVRPDSTLEEPLGRKKTGTMSAWTMPPGVDNRTKFRNVQK